MFTLNDIPLQKIHEGERVDLTQEEREQLLSEWNIEAERIEKEKALQYQRDRATAYPSIQEQLDLLYWDKVNGTNNWEAAIEAVKAEYPKG
jgi:hypothetical protein